MQDPNNLLSQESSKYGAKHGRPNNYGNPQATVKLFRVRMYDGDYDKGGVYWGGGGEPLFAAIGEDFEWFARAKSIENAKADLQDEFPELNIQLEFLNEFVDAALEVLLKLEVFGDDHEDAGQFYEHSFEISDFDEESRQNLAKDCARFIEENRHLLKPENGPGGNYIESAGHCYMLARNRYGDAFDFDWKHSDQLNDSAQKLSEVSIYIIESESDGKDKIGIE